MRMRKQGKRKMLKSWMKNFGNVTAIDCMVFGKGQINICIAMQRLDGSGVQGDLGKGIG